MTPWSHTTSHASRARSIDILLIEDDADHAEIFQRTLQNGELGARVRWVRSLDEGRRASLHPAPDVIVLDLGLGETQGIDTLDALDPARLPVPVVVLTATADVRVSREAIARGAQDYIWKFDLSPGTVERAIENSIERFALTRSLETANASLATFAAASAHQLRNPLQSILLGMSLIRDCLAEGDTDQAQESLDSIERASVGLGDLIERLLEFYHAGGDALDRESIALRPLVHEAIENLAARIEETHADIEIAESLPQVVASAPLIVSVLQNVLDNALTYTEEAPKVRISADVSGTECIVTIEDNGVGIPKESLEEIFRPLRRLHSDRIATEGAGVGLAICERILNAHGGRIWAESDPPRGSRLRLALPIASDAAGRCHAGTRIDSPHPGTR